MNEKREHGRLTSLRDAVKRHDGEMPSSSFEFDREVQLLLHTGQGPERSELPSRTPHPDKKPEGTVGHGSAARRPGHGENALLDGRGESKEPHDLRDTGAGDALAAGDVGLAGDLPGVEVTLPGTPSG